MSVGLARSFSCLPCGATVPVSSMSTKAQLVPQVNGDKLRGCRDKRLFFHPDEEIDTTPLPPTPRTHPVWMLYRLLINNIVYCGGTDAVENQFE